MPPRLGAALLRALLPPAERDEVLEDLADEHRVRSEASGPVAAWAWAWGQVLGSAPALARRAWWRGWTGFQPLANRWHPGGSMFESWAKDLRYVLRRLRRRPTYTLLSVLTLALGVAGTAAVYGMVQRLLVDALPVRAEEEVAVFWMEGSWSEAEFLALRPEIQGFSSLAAFRERDVTLQPGDAPARLEKGVAGTAELFRVLGATPVLGPGFRPGDDPDDHSGNRGLVGRLAPGTSPEAMRTELERLMGWMHERFQYPEGEWDKRTNPALTSLREHLVGSIRPALLATLAGMGALLLAAGLLAAYLPARRASRIDPATALRES